MSESVFVQGDDGLYHRIRKSHSCAYRLFYHFVWSPKYRKAVLHEERARVLADLLECICQDYGYEFLGLSIDDEHVHAFLGLPPRVSPSDAIRTLKSLSARGMLERFPELRAEIGRNALWTEGYSVDSVGWKNPAQLCSYLRRQTEHHGRPALVRLP